MVAVVDAPWSRLGSLILILCRQSLNLLMLCNAELFVFVLRVICRLTFGLHCHSECDINKFVLLVCHTSCHKAKVKVTLVYYKINLGQ